MMIRRLKLGDLPQVLRIERAAFRAEGYSAISFLLHLARDYRGAFVACEDGQVVGYSLARLGRTRDGIRRGGITSLAVAPGHRGRGVGRQLLARALEYLRERGAGEADLEVRADNLPAQSLYRSAGFRPAGVLPDYYGRGRDGLRMIKDLSEH